MSAAPEASSSSAAPVTDVAVRLLSMDLRGVNVTNTEEAIQFVMKHSLETRKDALMKVNQTMIKNKDRIEDAILGWSVVLGDLGQFGFDDDEALALSLEHGGIIETAANIQAVRNQKQRNLDALTTACIGLRGVRLLSTDCEGILQTAGKNFLNNMT